MTQKKLIVLENIVAGIGSKPIISNINWSVNAHENWIITGTMGSGKTTLCKTIAGQGRIFSGKRYYPFFGNLPAYEIRKQNIKFVSFADQSHFVRNINNAGQYYQKRYNAFDADGGMNVREYLRHGGYSEKNRRHNELLEYTGIEKLIDRELIKLSSGQNRRLLITKAILKTPKLLIIDNPYLGLDVDGRESLNALLDKFSEKEGTTIILSGHFEKLPKCIDHRIHLEHGTITQSDNLEKFKEIQKNTFYKNDCLKLIENYFKKNTPKNNFEPIVKMKKVSISYGGKNIFENIDWEIKPGEKWCIYGKNGSGKSTLLSLLYGDHPQAYANKISLFGKRRGRGESIWDIKKRIGFTSPELHHHFNYNFSAVEVVLSGLWDGFFIKKNPDQEQINFAKLLFQFFNLTGKLKTPFTELSTGEQRLLFFMRALIKTPPVLLLDEPFQGFDENEIKKSKTLLQHIMNEQNTFIFITHFKSEIPFGVNKIFELE